MREDRQKKIVADHKVAAQAVARAMEACDVTNQCAPTPLTCTITSSRLVTVLRCGSCLYMRTRHSSRINARARYRQAVACVLVAE